jgi:hypothetical protein
MPYDLIDGTLSEVEKNETVMVTHGGRCGACSSLRNLAVYIANPNLTEPIRACAITGLFDRDLSRLACIVSLAFDLPCAQAWDTNTQNTQKECLKFCGKPSERKKPSNRLHDCSEDRLLAADHDLVNKCLACDEEKSLHLFRSAAGRSRRGSGLPSPICRRCLPGRALLPQAGPMIENRGPHWACIAVGAAAMGLSVSAAAPAPSTEEPQEPSAGGETSTSKRNRGRRRGIDCTDYKNVIFFNFGSTAAGRVEIEYERALHRRVSIFAAWYVVFFDSLRNENLVGSGALVGARAFVLGGAPEGIWFAAQVGGYNRRSRDIPDVKQGGVQTGGMVGWTGVWNRFAVTLGAGFIYNRGRVTVLEQSMTLGEWSPWLKIGAGVAF